MSGARYFSSGRRRFLWNTSPTLRCPYRPESKDASGVVYLEGGSADLESMQAALAAAYGIDAETLLRSAHRSTRSLEGETNCPSCGAKLERVGFYAWIEGRYEDVIAEIERQGGDASGQRSSAAISRRLGFSEFSRWPGSGRYFPLRREAKAWCYEQSEIERAALREEARAEA